MSGPLPVAHTFDSEEIFVRLCMCACTNSSASKIRITSVSNPGFFMKSGRDLVCNALSPVWAGRGDTHVSVCWDNLGALRDHLRSTSLRRAALSSNDRFGFVRDVSNLLRVLFHFQIGNWG